MTEHPKNDPRILVLADGDNVAVLKATIEAGERINLSGQRVVVSQTLGLGHKLAVKHIPVGQDIVKYGFPIGFAETDIPLGAHVHVHNLTSQYTQVEVME
ncbi:Altronate dehydratase [Shimia sp. SK013]|uniref:UxaA family hydrolase n=1 Tax=Shimia sp. SK013 TaxID=1389006 RepID=UPI0006B62AC6|nr:UxaA family hydrolase [Shimia sp. SK013]KPA20284.1 Altronate dehydratase [Shimia sp. SK013]